MLEKKQKTNDFSVDRAGLEIRKILTAHRGVEHGEKVSLSPSD